MSALAPCFDRICVNNNHSSKNNNNDNVNKNNDEAINDSATNDGATSDGVNSDGLIDHAKWNRRKQKKPQRKNALSDAEDDRFEQQTRQRSDVTMTLAESRTLNNCYRGDVTRGTPGGQCEYNDDVTVTIRRSSQSGHFEISVHEEEEDESMDTSCLPDRETDRTNDKPSAGGPTDDRSGEAPNGRLGAQANDRSGNAPDERRGNAPDKTPETNCNRANLCAGLDRQGSSGIRDFNRPISGCPISTTSTFRTHFGGLIDSATGAPPLRTETEESARHNSTPDGGRCNQFGHSCETNKGSGQDGKENDAQSGYPLNGFEGRVRLVGQTGDDLMLGRVKQEANYSNGKLAKGDAMYVTTSDFPDVSIHRDETQAMTSTLSLSPSTDQNDVSFDCEDNADFDRQHHAAVYQAVSAGSATAAHHQSGVNVQACGVCSKTFANVYRLQRHLISHEESSELRKFKCPECSKAFKFKHHLKEHVRIHSGEKPFECPNCCKRFSHSGSYSSHMTSKKCWQIGNSGGGSGCGNGSGNGLGKIPIMRTTGDKQESTASLSVAASITNRILQQQPGYGEHPSPLTPPFYYNQTNFFNSSVIGQLDAIQRQSLLAEYIARWNGLYVPSLGLAPTGDASGRVPAALPLMYDQNISRYVQQCRSELGKNLLADWRGISEGSRTGCDLASLIKLKKPDENENAHRKSNTEPEVSEVPIKKEEQDCHSENAIIADAPKVVPIDTADPVTQKSERVASPECANNPTDTCKIENGIIVGSQRFEQTEKKESGHGDERKFEDGGRLLTPKGLLETEEDVQQGNNSMEKGTVDVETQGIVENKTDALDGMTAGEGHLVEQPGKLESGDGTAADIRVKDEKSDVSVPSIGTDERKSSPGVSIMCRYCSALFTSPVQLHQHERYLCKTVSIVSTALAKLTPSGELLPHRTSASVAFTPSSELLPNRGGTNNNTLAPSSERWTQGDQTRCSRTDDDERTTTSEEDGETGLNRCYRVRSMISGGQQQTLKAYYHRNARPSGPDLERLAAQVAFPKRVVQVWFQNMRARDRRRHKTFSEIRQPSVMAAYVDESSDISPRKPEPISAASSSINPQSNTIQQRLADHSGIVADQPHRVAKPEMPYRRTSGADYQGPSEDLSVQDVPLDLSAKPLDPPPTAHLARKSFSEDAFEESSVKALDLSFKENRCINTGTTSPDRKSFELPVSTATMTSSISNNLRNGFHSSLQSDSISPELAFLCRIPAINSSQEHSNDMRFVANNFNTATRKMALDYRLALKEGRRQRKRRHLLKSEADDHAKIPRSYLTYNGACADGTTGNAMSESGNGSSGETVFACDQCDKSFGKQSSLARHKYEHSGQRPFTCDLCSKAFKHKHHLTEHKRLHSGEKPYKCSKCGKTFSHSGSYSQHMNHRYKYCRPLIDGVDIDTDRSLEGTTQPETEVV